MLSQNEVISMIEKSKQGARFQFLMDNGIKPHYPSQSEGDLALTRILYWWTCGDRTMTESIFMSSKRYRDKYDRKDIREGMWNTVNNGIHKGMKLGLSGRIQSEWQKSREMEEEYRVNLDKIWSDLDNQHNSIYDLLDTRKPVHNFIHCYSVAEATLKMYETEFFAFYMEDESIGKKAIRESLSQLMIAFFSIPEKIREKYEDFLMSLQESLGHERFTLFYQALKTLESRLTEDDNARS